MTEKAAPEWLEHEERPSPGDLLVLHGMADLRLLSEHGAGTMKNSKIIILYAFMAAALVTLVLAGGTVVISSTHKKHRVQDIKIYQHSLAQEAEGLRQTFKQLVSVSNLLVKNPVVINTMDKHLSQQTPTEVAAGMVERNLAAIAAIDNISSVFLLDLDGICRYGSNSKSVGENHGAAIYFRSTLSRGTGLYAIMTIVSGQIGLYYAQLIKNGSQTVGIAVLDISPNFFRLHSFTSAFTNKSPLATELRIGLTTDNNILFNTTEGTLVALQPIPASGPSTTTEQLLLNKRIESLDFPSYDRRELFNTGFLRLKNAEGTEYYLFCHPLVSRELSLVHVIAKDWFHKNYHPASSDYSGYSGYIAMLGAMLVVMLTLLYMLNRRHRQALLAAETLKCEAEQRILDKEKYEAIINRNPQGFWLNDHESEVILEVNQSLCQMLNLEADQIVGRRTSEFLVQEDEKEIAKDASHEGRLRLSDGGCLDVLINSSCIIVPGNLEEICFSFFADISERKKEQEQLFLFSQAVEQSASAIVITDKNAKVVYVNPFFSEMTGYSREEACGINSGILAAGESGTLVEKEIWRQISSGGTWKGFLLGRRKDGTQYWEGQTICPLYDDKGTISYYLAIKNDITQRLELEKKFKAQLAKLELVVEHAAIGIAHIVDHRFAWVSRAAVEMFGYSGMEEISSMSTGEIFESEKVYQKTMQLAQLSFENDKVFHEDQMMRRKDGSLFWCSLTGKIIDPAAPEQGAIWLTKDISRQKEEELQLQLAKERAEQANRAKNDFLTNISHEFRTPMNAIIGMSSLALETSLDEQQRYYIGTVNKAAESLLGLINDVLDFSRIESGKLQLETAPFELERTIGDAVQTVRYPAEKKGLRLQCSVAKDVPLMVNGDALRLRQILVNLLSNSIKFSEKGLVSVQVSVQEDAADHVLLAFRISDQGIGIAPEKLGAIFEKFVQADTSASRDFEGTGLGLTICRQLCEMMGGRISVESVLHQGSVFTFTARFGHVSPKEMASWRAAAECSPPLRILVVDDNESNRFLAKAMLQRDAHQIVEAGNGIEALRILLDHHFDAILMDVQMPVMDGLAVTRIIRACEQDHCPLSDNDLPKEFREALQRRLSGGHLPIVALTAHGMKEDRQRCFEAGMDGYAVKPFKAREIYQAFQQTGCVDGVMPPSAANAAEQPQTNGAAMNGTAENGQELLAKVAEHLKNIYSLEAEQVEQMLMLSAKSIADTLVQARQAIADGNLADISAAGHKAKGVLLGVGLKDAADQARQVELSGRDGKQIDYSRMIAQLEEELRPLLDLSLRRTGS